MLEATLARIAGAYALRAYLPASLAARTLRNSLRRLRGKAGAPATRLPQVAWPQVLKSRPIESTETAKSDGNVRLSELAILALAAREAAPGSEIIEIGTFDGRTALNLAINAPARHVDCDARSAGRSNVRAGHRSIQSGAMSTSLRPARACANAARLGGLRPAASCRCTADSATFDWSAHVGRAGLVFVDGSHA